MGAQILCPLNAFCLARYRFHNGWQVLGRSEVQLYTAASIAAGVPCKLAKEACVEGWHGRISGIKGYTLLHQGVEMLAEVAAVSPQEYERQQKDDLASSGGVRNTAKFVEALADKCAPSGCSLCLGTNPHKSAILWSLVNRKPLHVAP